jgi:hypothetical protein
MAEIDYLRCRRYLSAAANACRVQYATAYTAVQTANSLNDPREESALSGAVPLQHDEDRTAAQLAGVFLDVVLRHCRCPVPGWTAAFKLRDWDSQVLEVHHQGSVNAAHMQALDGRYAAQRRQCLTLPGARVVPAVPRREPGANGKFPIRSSRDASASPDRCTIHRLTAVALWCSTTAFMTVHGACHLTARKRAQRAGTADVRSLGRDGKSYPGSYARNAERDE